MDHPTPASIARQLYAQGPLVLRTMQRWRPHICPFDALLEVVPPGSRVLDIGCGGGLFLGLLAMTGRLSGGVGFDASEHAIEAARAMAANASIGDRVRFARVDVGDPWPEGEFDLVSMIDIVHHVPPRDQRAFVELALSRVAAGGVLLYKDMADRPWWSVTASRLHDLVIALQWVHFVPGSVMVDWVEEKGARCVSRRTIDTLWYRHEIAAFERLPEHS